MGALKLAACKWPCNLLYIFSHPSSQQPADGNQCVLPLSLSHEPWEDDAVLVFGVQVCQIDRCTKAVVEAWHIKCAELLTCTNRIPIHIHIFYETQWCAKPPWMNDQSWSLAHYCIALKGRGIRSDRSIWEVKTPKQRKSSITIFQTKKFVPVKRSPNPAVVWVAWNYPKLVR